MKIGDILIWKSHDIAVRITGKKQDCQCGNSCLNLASVKNSNWGSISRKNQSDFRQPTKRNIQKSPFSNELIKDIEILKTLDIPTVKQ